MQITKEVSEMGMTDLQYKGHLQELIRRLEFALKETPENSVIKQMLEDYQKLLQS